MKYNLITLPYGYFKLIQKSLRYVYIQSKLPECNKREISEKVCNEESVLIYRVTHKKYIFLQRLLVEQGLTVCLWMHL